MPNLTAAIEKLPDRELEIRRLAACDESFSGLCDDLREATEALERWLGPANPQNSDRISEYESLVAALVTEVRASLDDALDPGRRPAS